MSSTSTTTTQSLQLAATWEQCGGVGWTGPTKCFCDAECKISSASYSQCQPPVSKPGEINEWGQCGGLNYMGSKQCVCGTVCTYQDAYYSQCKKISSQGIIDYLKKLS